MLPVYLISYNRLEWLKGMLDYFRRIPSVFPVILDNNSSYPPLLDWLPKSPVPVVHLGRNFGHLCVWTSGTVPFGDEHRRRYGSDFYVVTDPDLDLSRCPTDVFDVLCDGLRRHPDRVKAGVSLEIDDLPDHFPFKHAVRQWESAFWRRKIDDRFYDAPMDTQLAVYHCDRPFDRHNWIMHSLRADRPYTARHLVWYLDPAKLSDEDARYLRTATVSGHWTGEFRRIMWRRQTGPTPKML